MLPTLLVDVTPEMDIARNEVFGPVMVMMKAQDDEDALRIVSMLNRFLYSYIYCRLELVSCVCVPLLHFGMARRTRCSTDLGLLSSRKTTLELSALLLAWYAYMPLIDLS
jgi:hypothetical protein